MRDYAAHLYIGTSSWLAAHVPFKKTDIVSSLASVPCAIPGRYLLTALQATAGGNLTFLRDKILYHKDELLQEEHVPDVYKIMDRIAERTPAGSHGVLYTPWIYGERAPVEDATVRAAIYNLSLENSREDIIRAVLEGVAFNTRWLLRPFEKFLRPLARLHQHRRRRRRFEYLVPDLRRRPEPPRASGEGSHSGERARRGLHRRGRPGHHIV